jgi:hypothetical protein
MRCPHGCAATAHLSVEQLIEVILRSFEIGGHRDYAAHADAMRALAADPRLGPAMLRLLRGHTSARQEFKRVQRRRLAP